MLRRRRVGLLLGTALLLTGPPSAASADYNAGEACSTAGAFHTKNDSDAATHLICDGSVWVTSVVFDKDGPVGIGTAAPDTELDVAGDISAEQYCDADGSNCFSAASIGSATAAGPDRAIQFNSSSSLAGSSSFVFTSAGTIELTTGSAATKGLVVKATASQSAHLQEWQDASGTATASVQSDGTFSRAVSATGVSIFADFYQADSGGTNDYGAIRINGARGTVASPDYVWSDRPFGGLIFRGRTDTKYLDGIRIEAVAKSSWNNANAEAALRFMALNTVGSETYSVAGYVHRHGIVAGDTLGGSAPLSVTSSTSSPMVIYGTGGSAMGAGTDAQSATRWGIQSGNGSVLTGTLFNVERSTGNVGIGTTNQSAKLEVRPSASGKGIVVRAHATTPGNLQEWQDASGTVGARVTSSMDFSNSEGRSGAEKFGAGATVGGTDSTVIGAAASGNGGGDTRNVSIGSEAKAWNRSIAIGHLSQTTGNYGIALGLGATAKANEFVAGSSSGAITNVRFGTGGKSGSGDGVDVTLHGDDSGSGGSGDGGDLILAAGAGKGSGGGGAILFQTADLPASSGVLQTITTKLTITSSGNLGIGTSTPTAKLHVDGDIHYTGAVADVSDRRLKDHITPLADQLVKITALQPVSFVMKGDSTTELGLIAQDVEPLFPELVKTNPDGMKTLNYVGLIAPMIGALQEQQEQIEELQRENADLSRRVDEIEAMLKSAGE